MRLKIPAYSKGVPLNMTPMIDVVFLLLIFFLVASQFAQVEYDQSVDLPKAESSESLESQPSKSYRLVIQIDQDEQWTLAGNPVNLMDVENHFETLAQSLKPDQIEVRIGADRKAPYRSIEPLLMTCAENGIWDVNFAVLPEGTPQ